MIEEGQIANVQRERTARPFLLHHHRDGAAFDAFAKTDSTAAREPRVRESFQHPGTMILQERLDLLIDAFLRDRSEVPLADRAVSPDEEGDWHPDDRPIGVFERVLPEKERIVHVFLGLISLI